MPNSPQFDPSFCEIALDLGLKGRTFLEIAKALNVTPKTLLEWEKRYLEMHDALTPAYETALLRQVVRQLSDRQKSALATGIRVSEVVDER